MARESGSDVSASWQRDSRHERSVRSTLAGHNYRDRVVGQAEKIFAGGMVLVFGFPGADDRNCASRRAIDG